VGMLDLRHGRPAQATIRFQRALAWTPQHIDAWAGLARALDARGRTEDARHAHENRALLLHDLVRARPWEADLAVEAARAYVSAGRPQKARTLLLGVRRHLRTPEAHKKVGDALRELEETK